MKYELDPAGVDNLRIAVVECACKDYRKALRSLSRWANAAMHGKTITAGMRENMHGQMRVITECEMFFERYCQFWVDLDGLQLRDEMRRQSGINEELLEQMKDAYTNRQRRTRKDENQSTNGVSESGRAEGVSGRAEDLHVQDLGAYSARNDDVWGTADHD